MAPKILPHFTQDQKEFISSFIPSFETYLQQHNLNGTRDPDTSHWIKRTVDSIMRDERLSAAHLGGRDPSKVRQTIRTYFRNWKNHQYKHALQGQSTFPHITQTLPQNENNKTYDRLPKKVLASVKDAMRALVVLDGDITPQQLFYLQEPEHHEKIYKDMREDPLNKDVLPWNLGQKAKVKAWANADQDDWARRKKELMLDVNSNWSIYPDMLRASIQQNLDRGVVGTVLIGIMIAFCTESGIQHGISYCGHDALSGREIPHMPS
ncbi:hypothetical protein BJ165DRAFT_871375 [Panaeolus papilionaceus]|nr:hypothetical protein BJ165DRAFT_871375 [Panaeolus papilionaceus]